jgi:pyruvate/2-oxoglutarate dehydrogenase complex dihydrolipoamide dehydrogenase (E3) component
MTPWFSEAARAEFYSPDTWGDPGAGVAVIERRHVGGSCPNIARMPRKGELIANSC